MELQSTHCPVIAVKAVFGDVVRRFTIRSCFAELEGKARDLFKVTGLLVLKFKDEDGDLITMSSDAELLEAARIASACKPPVLRVQITMRVEKPQIDETEPERRAELRSTEESTEEHSLGSGHVDKDAREVVEPA